MSVKSFYPWVGGKRRVLDFIEANIPEQFGNYHEPFLGGGAVALRVLEHAEPGTHTFYLSDYNSEIVAAWLAARDHLEEFTELIQEHYDRHTREYFMSVRGWDVRGLLPAKTTVERGARFVYLVSAAFRGMWIETTGVREGTGWREARAGEIIPEGTETTGLCKSSMGHEDIRGFNFANLNRVSELLNAHRTVITAQDFRDGLQHIVAGDFVYLDPPYATDDDEGTDTFAAYTAESADPALQRALKRYMGSVTSRGAYALASNADTNTTRGLFDGWNQISKSIIYSLGFNADAGRQVKKEVLFANHNLYSTLVASKQVVVT